LVEKEDQCGSQWNKQHKAQYVVIVVDSPPNDRINQSINQLTSQSELLQSAVQKEIEHTYRKKEDSDPIDQRW
jgi:mannose/fructose/N-acetylgalactosamine-specific phosphotransferase system component IIB